MVKQSEMIEQGTPVSYLSDLGGFGFGYRLNGKVYRSGGNGFYYPTGVQRVWVDGGEVYQYAVRGTYPSDLFPEQERNSATGTGA